jgi:hypothetical protein
MTRDVDRPSGARVASSAEEPEIRVSFREGATVALLLALLLAIAYGNVVFFNKSLVYSDNLNPLDYRPTDENYGHNFVPPWIWQQKNLIPYPNLHDPGATWWQWEPGGEFLRKGLMAGEWPFWDPYIGAGTPAMANVTPAFFFPPYLLIVVLGNTSFLKNLYFLLLLFSAGLFTYLFLRKNGLRREACFFGAIVFMFCGGLSQNVGSFIGQAAACLPLALYVTRRFLDGPSWIRAATLSITYAAISLASFPPVLLAVFGIAAAYVGIVLVFFPGEAGEHRPRVAWRFAAACALAVGLVGFYYLPIFALMRMTPQVAAFYSKAAEERLIPICFLQLFSPTLMGGSRILANPPINDAVLWSPLPYIGMTPMIALLFSGPVARARKKALFLMVAVATLFVVLKLIGAQPVQAISHLPGLRTIHFITYLGIPLNFLLALMAALGLDRVVTERVTRVRLAVPVLLIASALLTIRQIAKSNGALAHPAAAQWLKDWRFLLVITIAGLVIVAWMTAIRRRDGRSPGSLSILFLAVFVVEAIHNTFYPRQYEWNVWRHPVPYVRGLQRESGSGRVFGIAAFNANAGSAFEIFELDSLMAFNPPRIHELYRRYVSAQSALFLRSPTEIPAESILDRANIELLVVRRVFHSPILECQSRGYPSIYRDDYVEIFRRRGSPRYYFTSDYEVVSAQAALDAMGELPLGSHVLLETSPGFPALPGNSDDSTVTIRRFRRNSYSVELRAPRPGLIYCSESYFPGWRARVNGRPAEILPANYAFRAIPVPAGPVLVEVFYWPPGMTAGLAISIAALLGLAGIFALGRRELRKQVPIIPHAGSPGSDAMSGR